MIRIMLIRMFLALLWIWLTVLAVQQMTVVAPLH